MTSNIILYTIGCPKCKVLEMKLNKAGIVFSTVTDTDTVVAVGKEHGINTAPILKINDDYFDFVQAVKQINEGKF